MNRRPARKVLGNAIAYPPHQRERAGRRWFRLRFVPGGGSDVALAWSRYRPSSAALRADRVLRLRYEDDAGRWLAGDGPPPSMYGTTTKENRR